MRIIILLFVLSFTLACGKTVVDNPIKQDEPIYPMELDFDKYIDSMRNGFGGMYIVNGDTLYVWSDS